MRSAGLVDRKNIPRVSQLDRRHRPAGRVQRGNLGRDRGFTRERQSRNAAAALRHHLEYASRRLADNLGARPVFKSDGNYELGELLPSVLVRLRELCGKSAEAAQSWKNDAAKEVAVTLKANLSSCNGAINVEQSAVNKAVHYNEWANFGRKDFEPVVAAFKELLECFRCAECGGVRGCTRHRAETLTRCDVRARRSISI